MIILDGFIRCCPVCGMIFPDFMFVCIDCNYGVVGKYNKLDKAISKEDRIYFSKYEVIYYKEQSLNKYNTTNKWYNVFIDDELSKQSKFSQEKHQIHLKEQAEREQRIKDREEHPEKYQPKPVIINKPKCPTCQSINIKKISATKRVVHGYAFGLFSKTARSQFECKNCGYKW